MLQTFALMVWTLHFPSFPITCSALYVSWCKMLILFWLISYQDSFARAQLSSHLFFFLMLFLAWCAGQWWYVDPWDPRCAMKWCRSNASIFSLWTDGVFCWSPTHCSQGCLRAWTRRKALVETKERRNVWMQWSRGDDLVLIGLITMQKRSCWKPAPWLHCW